MPAHIESSGVADIARRPVLAVAGLSKSFGGVQALTNVSLSLRKGEIRAICGENGAGKSTLVKLLMGIIQPDSGVIEIDGSPILLRSSAHAQNMGLGLVAQELSLAPHLSVFDNIWLGSPLTPFFHRNRKLRERAQAALDALGVSDWGLEAIAAGLSIAQKQVVEIARLIARDARILILDEPTATLNDSEIERMMKVLKALRDKGNSILYISHRLGEIFELCDSVTVFRNGRHIATAETCAIKRDELVGHILGRPLSEMYPPPLANSASASMVVVERLSVGASVRDLSFAARRGEIVCLAGQIGSGANLVTRALAGLAPDARGRVTIDGRLAPLRSPAKSVANGILFISDDRAAEGLFSEMQVVDNIVALDLASGSSNGLLNWRKLRDRAMRHSRRVGLDPGRLHSSVGVLSGGNQQKILFGRILRQGRPGLLLLSEPTRGIDVGARAELYRVMRSLCAEGYAMIMYSSDLEEIAGMADVVITLFRGRMVARYERDEIDLVRILSDITHPTSAAA